MKPSGKTPPLRVGARIALNKDGLRQIEWSEIEPMADDDTPHDDLPDHEKNGFFKRLKYWIDEHIGAHKTETRMLRRLHKTPRLEIVVLQEDEKNHRRLDSQMQSYWNERETRHKRLAMLSALLLIPSALLFVLPGPNVLGLGVTYLLWHHWQILRGIKKLKTGQIPVEYHPEPAQLTTHSGRLHEQIPD